MGSSHLGFAIMWVIMHINMQAHDVVPYMSVKPPSLFEMESLVCWGTHVGLLSQHTHTVSHLGIV